MKVLSLSIFLFFPTIILGQSWQNLDYGVSFPVICTYYDSTTGYLYAGGQSWWPNTHVPNYHAIARWNSNEWDSMGIGLYGTPVRTIIRFHDTIWVGGSFSLAGGLPTPYLAKWDGQQWIATNYGFNGSFDKLREFNGNLYAVGGFDSVQGKEVNGVAVFDGINWNPIGNIWNYYANSFDHNVINDIAIYNNKIYVSGVIRDSAGHTQRILMFDGTKWDTVGSGFHGSFCDIGPLAVYKNELYAGGLFTVADGNNPADYIAKWNGSNWSDVGGGVQGYYLMGNGQVRDLYVIKDDLYAAGVFQYADSIPALYVAKWNGSQWCSLGNTGMDNIADALGAIGDTLILGGGFRTLNNDSVFFIAKYLGGDNVDSCSAPVGISQINQSAFDFSIYPNPANSEIQVTVPSNSEAQQLKIINTLVQIIKQQEFFSTQISIDISDLPAGVYLVEIQTEKDKAVKKFVKQ